jgi:hypothetical protein
MEKILDLAVQMNPRNRDELISFGWPKFSGTLHPTRIGSGRNGKRQFFQQNSLGMKKQHCNIHHV